jgi:hypothetical protein
MRRRCSNVFVLFTHAGCIDGCLFGHIYHLGEKWERRKNRKRAFSSGKYNDFSPVVVVTVTKPCNNTHWLHLFLPTQGQLKIIIAYIQIMASMPGVMESVPWPETFTSFTVPFTAVNFNFMGIFAQSSCGLSLRFPQQFVVQMSLPLFLAMSAGIALCMSNIVGKTEMKQHRSAQATKILLLLILFVYPGLCTGVFTMFRVSGAG